MSVPIRCTGPVAAKQLHIASRIRGRITSGKYAPGERLPTVQMLCTEYSVASATMQKAMQRLKDDELLYAVRGGGTYVSARPPHLHRVAVVFESAPGDADWNMFWQALFAAAEELQETTSMSFPCYTGVLPNTSGGDLQRLVADIEAQRLRGIIFARTPTELLDTPLMEDMAIPRVSIMSELAYPSVGAIVTDWGDYCRKALARLRALGRERVAIITSSNENHAQLRAFRRVLDEEGFDTERYWLQAVPHTDPKWARNMAHALLAHSHRPDAIFVTDDHMISSVLDGVRDSDLQAGRELEILAHWNFPNAPTETGVTYIGFDAREFLTTGVQLFDKMLNGGRRSCRVKALFADRLVTASRSVTNGEAKTQHQTIERNMR